MFICILERRLIAWAGILRESKYSVDSDENNTPSGCSIDPFRRSKKRRSGVESMSETGVIPGSLQDYARKAHGFQADFVVPSYSGSKVENLVLQE